MQEAKSDASCILFLNPNKDLCLVFPELAIANDREITAMGFNGKIPGYRF